MLDGLDKVLEEEREEVHRLLLNAWKEARQVLQEELESRNAGMPVDVDEDLNRFINDVWESL